MKLFIDYFLISAIITFIILFIINPTPQIIVKYPSGEVSDTYVDDNNVCYKYYRKKVDCLWK